LKNVSGCFCARQLKQRQSIAALHKKGKIDFIICLNFCCLLVNDLIDSLF